MKRLAFWFVLFVLAATTAKATDFASHHLLIPIAGRTAGAFGTEWKTDLVVTNAARQGEPVSVEIYFLVDGNLSHPIVANLWPRQSEVLKDVIGSAFGKQTASGLILISTRDPNAKLTARARIYNTGGKNGEYGQIVPAMPTSRLSREAYIPGLSGVNGSRTNVGISNPDAFRASVFISLFDREGELRGGFATEIKPYSVLQLNDVFSHFQSGPLDGAAIQVTSSHGVYTYASIVRNDSGDADFVAGTSTLLDETHNIVAPQCASPATLLLAPLPATGWTVLFKPGVNPHTATPTLEARHGFNADRVYDFGGFHSGHIPPDKLAALRCEASIRVIEQNGYVPLF